MSHAPSRGAPIALLVLAGCGDAEERAQVVVRVDTDAPVPPAATAHVAGFDRQPALVDSLLVELLAADGATPACGGCDRTFAVHEAMFRDREVSFGVVPSSGAVVVRTVLYGAERLDPSARPLPSTSIDVLTHIAAASDGIVSQTIRLPVARWGSGPGTADGPQVGAPDGSAVGTWPGAARTRCGGPVRPDTGLQNGDVCVAGGAYVMGSLKIVGLTDSSERLRLVTIDPLFLDAHEYTVARYRDAVARGFTSTSTPLVQASSVNAGEHWCTLKSEPGSAEEERYPLTCVSDRLASDLCAFDGLRLPTEAEWEFEASGRGEGREFAWGDAFPDCAMAVFARAGAGYFELNPKQCVLLGFPQGNAPVGSAPGDRSKSGALDMSGGVAELVADRWNRPHEACWASTAPYVNPLCDMPSTVDGEQRSVRGGAWNSPESGLRVALRQRIPVSYPHPGIGFRCARSG